jgi:MFS transporter, FSR family, fosmidomycin resistance protein
MEEGRKSLVGTSVAHLINDGLGGVLPLMYPFFVSSYQLTDLAVSVLSSLQSVFTIVVSPFIGRRLDASGDFARMMAAGLAIFAIGAGGYALGGLFSTGTTLVILLLPFTVMIGVGSAFYHPIGATILRSKWKVTNLGRAMGINGSAGSIGRIGMPLTAAVLISEFTLPSLGIIAAFSFVGAFVALAFLRGMEFRGSGQRAQTTMKGNLARRMFPLTVVSFSRGLFTGVLPLIPLYLIQVDRFSTFQADTLFALTLGVGIASQLLFGWMHDRVGPRIALAISNLGGVMVLFVFSLTTDPTLVVVSLLLFGLFSYSAFPLLLGLVHLLTDFDEMTSASSIVWGIGNSGGSAVAPLLIGALALPMFYGSLIPGFVASAAIGIVSVVALPLVRGMRRPS